VREIQFGVSQDVPCLSCAFAQRLEKEKNTDAARFFNDILYGDDEYDEAGDDCGDYGY